MIIFLSREWGYNVLCVCCQWKSGKSFSQKMMMTLIFLPLNSWEEEKQLKWNQSQLSNGQFPIYVTSWKSIIITFLSIFYDIFTSLTHFFSEEAPINKYWHKSRISASNPRWFGFPPLRKRSFHAPISIIFSSNSSLIFSAGCLKPPLHFYLGLPYLWENDWRNCLRGDSYFVEDDSFGRIFLLFGLLRLAVDGIDCCRCYWCSSCCRWCGCCCCCGLFEG